MRTLSFFLNLKQFHLSSGEIASPRWKIGSRNDVITQISLKYSCYAEKLQIEETEFHIFITIRFLWKSGWTWRQTMSCCLCKEIFPFWFFVSWSPCPELSRRDQVKRKILSFLMGLRYKRKNIVLCVTYLLLLQKWILRNIS